MDQSIFSSGQKAFLETFHFSPAPHRRKDCKQVSLLEGRSRFRVAAVDENDRRLLFRDMQGCQDVTYRSALLVLEVVNGKPILSQGSEQFDGNFHLKMHLIKS
jgi:hypothetical protein